MTFASAKNEMRERFTEAMALLIHIRQQSPEDFVPLDSVQKSIRGLWLVSLYGAFERSANAIVEAAIEEISSHRARSIDCMPPIQSIIHYPKIQAVKDCGSRSVFDKSVSLFNAVFGGTPLPVFDNPLADQMQNVDASTLTWVAGLFGLEGVDITQADRGRLNTLRERRNAVAHGREAASEVGERYTLDEMNNLYTAADRATTTFLLALTEHCTRRLYLRAA